MERCKCRIPLLWSALNDECQRCKLPVDKIVVLRYTLIEAKKLIEYMHGVTILQDSNRDLETYSNQYANTFNLINDVIKAT